MRRRGFSVSVFLPDGDPDGVKVVEKSNWTGCGLVVPRALFGDAKSRDELSEAGVYILVGQDGDAPLPTAYVGEGDPVRPRLEQHAKSKDFWTHVVVFIGKGQPLNKAHVQYLEARLVAMAASAKRSVLDNGNVPQKPSLSERDIAEVEGFLDDMLLCLPILGYGLFESAPSVTTAKAELLLGVAGLSAKGYEASQGFVVREGSQAFKAERGVIHPYMAQMRDEFLRQGLFRDAGDVWVLTQDYTFGSPSTAAGVLLGRNSNGRVEGEDVGRANSQEHPGRGGRGVTAGLQPYPETKDSAVPWLGEVPSHWDIRRLRSVAEMRASACPISC